MSSLMTKLGIDRLSEAERTQLLDELLDSFAGDREPPPMSEALKQELDRRIAYLDAHPEAGSPWEEVKARILARLGK